MRAACTSESGGGGMAIYAACQRAVFQDAVAAVPQHSSAAASATWHACILVRSEEHTSELQSLLRISYAVFCLNKNKKTPITQHNAVGIHHYHKNKIMI